VREVVSKRKENVKLYENGKLKERDIEILKFVLEMKFVSIEEVYEKFFKVKMNGEKSKSDWWARDRVYQLKKMGFLKAVHFFTEARAFYVATHDAYHLLGELYPLNFFCKPTTGLDVRTFHHDWLVTKSRLVLENQGRVTKWISEKTLKTQDSINLGIAKKYMPDGCYIDQNEKVVAFELELTLKSRSRYRDKIRLYANLMRQKSIVKSLKFEKCLFICRTQSVAENLKRQTLPFGSLFEIRMLDELGLKPLNVGVQ
jgi:hypothetical protein